MGLTYPDSIEGLRTEDLAVPEGAVGLAPATVDDVAEILRYAYTNHKIVDVIGGGSHHGFGSPQASDIVMSMGRFDNVEVWDPDDMTIVVGAGMPIGRLEGMIAERSQTAVLPEVPGKSTVGGTIAAGLSALRRGRLLGTRERVLEVTMVTGDGRVIRAGGRVVKNVTGYDLPRLVVGAFGSLGVITSVCLKVWPVPPAAKSVFVDEFPDVGIASRPLAILETADQKSVYLWGTESEVEAVSQRIGGEAIDELRWPVDPEGPFRWSLRVPPSKTSLALTHIDSSWRYLAVHGVGDIRLASDTAEGASGLRSWADSVGGHLVVVDSPPGGLHDFDPWGRPPPGVELQRRIIAQFDPGRVINPGRLPAGL